MRTGSSVPVVQIAIDRTMGYTIIVDASCVHTSSSSCDPRRDILSQRDRRAVRVARGAQVLGHPVLVADGNDEVGVAIDVGDRCCLNRLDTTDDRRLWVSVVLLAGDDDQGQGSDQEPTRMQVIQGFMGLMDRK